MATGPSAERTGAGGQRGTWYAVLGLVVLGAVGTAIFWQWSREAEPPETLTWDGPSADLKQTVIVPTLDTPIPPGKSAVWCASFQVAWNRLKKDLAKGPVQLENAQEIADRLNQAEQSEDDLAPGEYYAAAGFAKDGIVKRILREMAAKFPDVPATLADKAEGVAVAYAYLKADVRFKHPYHESNEPLVFTDSEGKRTRVSSFGIGTQEGMSKRELPEQVAVLFARFPEAFRAELEEFALDLCKYSEPTQLVLAIIPRKATLSQALAHVQQRITEPAQEFAPSALSRLDVLQVPDLLLRAENHFHELEGPDKRFGNPALQGLYLDTALQLIQFKLHHRGAELSSEARLSAKGIPLQYYFNRPFLLYLKKRDAQHPFFVMWVDNAELLQKRD